MKNDVHRHQRHNRLPAGDKNRFRRYVLTQQAIKTTAITEYELLKHGKELKREIAEKFLSAIAVCPFDRASAKQAALLFEKLSKNGTMINENDLLIAGIALANNDILLTRDKNLLTSKKQVFKLSNYFGLCLAWIGCMRSWVQIPAATIICPKKY